MAVHGGILTSSDPRQRKAFVTYGIIGVVLVLAQGYFLYQDNKHTDTRMGGLEYEVRQLKEQGQSLLNTVKLQATLDDIKGIEAAISDGFAHLEAVIKGKRVPPQQPKQQLPPPVVEHIRFVQRRTASTRDDAPYGIQVFIQADTTIQPVALKINCDQPILDGKFFIAGQAVYITAADGYSDDHKSYLFSFRNPPLTPESPLVVTLLSKEDIRVISIERIAPLY